MTDLVVSFTDAMDSVRPIGMLPAWTPLAVLAVVLVALAVNAVWAAPEGGMLRTARGRVRKRIDDLYLPLRYERERRETEGSPSHEGRLVTLRGRHLVFFAPERLAPGARLTLELTAGRRLGPLHAAVVACRPERGDTGWFEVEALAATTPGDESALAAAFESLTAER